MTPGTNLLLVGSLPPQPSHAALLTQTIADLLVSNGINVTCLIDELAPPPPEGLSCTVIRPFMPDFLDGAYDNWPRLYVVGGDGGSLMALEMLHASPGPVVLAEDSVFSLTEAWLQETDAGDKSFYEWLAKTQGKDGETLARSILMHRRTSSAIGKEVSAVDLLCAPATHIFTIGQHHLPPLHEHGVTSLEPFYPLATLPDRGTNDAPPPPAQDLKILVIGMGKENASLLSKAIDELAESTSISISFQSRFAQNIDAMIADADVVAILDGQHAVFCPYVHTAIAGNKAIIHAGQRWTSIFPLGSTLMVDHPHAVHQLAMTFAALSRADGLLTALTEKMTIDINQASQCGADWSSALMAAAKKATTINHPTLSKLPDIAGQPTQIDQTSITPNTDSTVALVGAVPARPILEKLIPTLDIKTCPRFMTSTLASKLSEVMNQPRSILTSQMGFEASLVSETAAPPHPNADTKVRPWPEIRQGLRAAQTGVAFGCQIEGLSPAPTGKGMASIRWSFYPPAPKDHRPTSQKLGRETGYDEATGVYWVYSGARKTLQILVFTGSPGELVVSSPGSNMLVISDKSQTGLFGGQDRSTLSIAAHGVGHFQVAVAPNESGYLGDLMKILADQGLLLEWSPL